MKNVYLTGSTGGIGQAIRRRLELAGYHVIPITSRLEDVDAVVREVKDLLESSPVDILVNCAGFGRFRPHEEISPEIIGRMVAVNLTAPMLLCQMCLRTLKERNGKIINITSVEATRHSRFSAVYTAAKSGLRHFSLSLFEEVRKSGVGVTSINPGMTRTGFFDDLDFGPSEDETCSLDPDDVAKEVLRTVESSQVITDVTIQPQRAGVKRKSSREA